MRQSRGSSATGSTAPPRVPTQARSAAAAAAMTQARSAVAAAAGALRPPARRGGLLGPAVALAGSARRSLWIHVMPAPGRARAKRPRAHGWRSIPRPTEIASGAPAPAASGSTSSHQPRPGLAGPPHEHKATRRWPRPCPWLADVVCPTPAVRSSPPLPALSPAVARYCAAISRQLTRLVASAPGSTAPSIGVMVELEPVT